MKALTVIHLEYDPKLNKDYYEDIRALSERVGEETSNWMSPEKKVYFLGAESKNLDSELIGPEIRKHSGGISYIPADIILESQFLTSKDIFIKEGVTESSLCGIKYGYCVPGFNSLLLGGDHRIFKKDYYEKLALAMGWSQNKFEEVYNHIIHSEILKELTL